MLGVLISSSNWASEFQSLTFWYCVKKVYVVKWRIENIEVAKNQIKYYFHTIWTITCIATSAIKQLHLHIGY